MPELAEVEIVRRNLKAWWTAPATDVRLHDEDLLKRGAPELLNELLTAAVPEMKRRGKYLIAAFDADRAIIFHFRMTGKIIATDDPEPRFARLAWNSADHDWLVFKDARRLGQVEVFDTGELDDYEPLQKMGPEPYGLTAEDLADLLPSRRRLKDALLDQSVIAGIGNIAITEIFWRLELPPDIGVSDLSDDQIAALADEMPRYFDWLIADQMDDEVVYLGEGKERNPFDVYKREGEPCPRCGVAIERAKIGGRSSYYCPDCQ